MLIGYAVKLVSIIALYIYMYLENKRRDRMAANGEIPSSDDGDAVENGMLVSLICLPFLEAIPCAHTFLAGPNRNRQ